MIDLHTHIIYNVDDGCKSIEESIDTIINLCNLGFKKIILTPHYIKGTNYTVNNEEKLEMFNKLKFEVKKHNIDVELYLGNEIYFNYELEDLMVNNVVYPINDSRYLLIELPLYNEINGVIDYLYELKLKGFIPIIAHPERYSYFQKDYKKMDELYDSGILFQSNYGSIIGLYGNDAKKLVKYALKKDMISFMSTDIHNPNFSLINNFDKVVKKIKKIVGEERFKDITYNNALRVIENKTIEN